MTGATPVPECSGGRDRILTAAPPAGPGSRSGDAGARAEEVEASIVALWQAYGKDRDATLRDRLVLHYAPLVKYVAGRVGTGLPAHVDIADLVQSGVFGLWDAIDRYEPERGLKFETYAMQRIRGAILDELRAQDWVPRSVRSRARDVERALERLESRLQRSASDAEVAAELGITVAELRELYAQLQMTSVVALDELIAVGRGGKYNRIRTFHQWTLEPNSGGTRLEYVYETEPPLRTDRFIEAASGRRGWFRRNAGKGLRRLQGILEENRGRGARATVAGLD